MRKTLKAFSSAFLCRRTLPATTAAISLCLSPQDFSRIFHTNRVICPTPQAPGATGRPGPPTRLLSSFRYQPTNLRTRRLHAQCPLIMRMIIIARRCFHRHDCGHTMIDSINHSLHLFSSSLVSFEPFYKLSTVDWADV